MCGGPDGRRGCMDDRARVVESFMHGMPGDEDFNASLGSNEHTGRSAKADASTGTRAAVATRTPSVVAKMYAAIGTLTNRNSFPMPCLPPISSGRNRSTGVGDTDYSSFGSPVSTGALAPLACHDKIQGRGESTTLLPASRASLSVVSTKSASSWMSAIFNFYGVNKGGASVYGHKDVSSGTGGGSMKSATRRR